MGRALCCVLLSALTIAACGDAPTPTSPRPGTTKTPPGPVLLRPICAPVQTEVHCTVVWAETRSRTDVTQLANWSVSSAPLSQIDTDVATVARPGVIVPLRRGSISILAAYGGQSSLASHSYAVEPGLSAVPLAPYLSGSIAEASTNFTVPVAGVLVEVLAPPSEVGKNDAGRLNGHYFINHVPMNVPITLRASKAGYPTTTKTHPGITDDSSLGVPLNSSLHFELAKVQ